MIRSIRLLTTMAIVLSGILSCSYAVQAESLTSEVWQQIEENKAVLVDVRSAEELRLGSIEQAEHVPHTQLVEGAIPETWVKQTPLYLFCRSGRRAALAQQALQERGYSNVHVVGGYTRVKESLKEIN